MFNHGTVASYTPTLCFVYVKLRLLKCTWVWKNKKENFQTIYIPETVDRKHPIINHLLKKNYNSIFKYSISDVTLIQWYKNVLLYHHFTLLFEEEIWHHKH